MSRELTRQEKAAIRKLVTKWCANYEKEGGGGRRRCPCFVWWKAGGGALAAISSGGGGPFCLCWKGR